MAYEKLLEVVKELGGNIEELGLLGNKFTAVHAVIVVRQIAVFAQFPFLVCMRTG